MGSATPVVEVVIFGRSESPVTFVVVEQDEDNARLAIKAKQRIFFMG